MAAKLVNLIALSSLVILACSFGPSSANALSVEFSPNHARHLGHHQLLAKKKRDSTRRCKPRPSSSSLSSSAAPTSPPASKPTSSKKPPPVSTPAPPPPPPPAPPSTGGGGKVGLAWPNGDDSSLKNFKTNKVSAIYTWGPWKPELSDSLGLVFAPMLWGPKQIGDFQNLVKRGYAQHVLGFNEPEIDGQSSLDPGYAASLWKQYIQPLKGEGYTLISPAVTSDARGIPWLTEFISDCSGCTIDEVALHWYGTDPQAFISYVENFHTTFGRNIWVTEFACQNFAGGAQCSAGQVQTFMDTVTNWMDNTPYITYYFAFGIMHDMGNVNVLDQLMAGDGQPTALGRDYIN